MRNFELQLKEVRENLKTLNKGSSRKEQPRESKENNEGIKDKIN